MTQTVNASRLACFAVSFRTIPGLRLGALLGLVIGVIGCKELTGSPGLSAGTPNPDIYRNAAGALGMRNAALFELEQALPRYVIDAGLLTDELEDRLTGASTGVLLSSQGVSDGLDERILPENVSGGADVDYTNLQKVRGFIQQALGALAAYDTARASVDSATVLRGELYAFEGYAEILLADLFCSGVPLSTLTFQGDFVYAPGSTTAGVYKDAIAKLDSALLLGRSSDSVVHLARVLQGRAELALANYQAAADDVAGVPDGFQYQVAAQWQNGSSSDPTLLNSFATVSDREGENGLPFLSHGDVRTAVTTVEAPNPGGGGPFVPLTFPVKYGATFNGAGFAPFTMASGIEARLIQAEAQLNGVTTGTGSWIDKLNVLRQTVGLTTIADPGTGNPVAQLDTLFTERAYWLFLDGHRQGDLRRLLRQYNRYPKFQVTLDSVYPAGTYIAPGIGQYGTDVTVPIPNGSSGESPNSRFIGCLDRNP